MNCTYMTLEEAIEHSKQMSNPLTKCGQEHEQLAQWLEELKLLRSIVTTLTKERDELKTKLTHGVGLIAAERQRQISQKGWTSKHDDEHDEGELALAAACYAAGKERTHLIHPLNSPRGMEEAGYSYTYSEPAPGQITWPWDSEYYKPGDDRICELVKAGALIAAEIDRLQRKQQ